MMENVEKHVIMKINNLKMRKNKDICLSII